MISLGVAPGLSALAYSVVQFTNGSSLGRPVDSDVLHAARGITAQSAWEVAKRCRAHHLILDVITERHAPAVVGIGPPLNPAEAPEHVAAARLLVTALAAALRLPVVSVLETEALLAALGSSERTLNRAVSRELSVPLGSRDRRIVLATGAAIAGHRGALHVKRQATR